MQGKITFLLQSEDPLLQELYSKIKGQCLSPKTIVTYDREALSLFFRKCAAHAGQKSSQRPALSGFPLPPGVVMHRVSEGSTVVEIKY